MFPRACYVPAVRRRVRRHSSGRQGSPKASLVAVLVASTSVVLVGCGSSKSETASTSPATRSTAVVTSAIPAGKDYSSVIAGDISRGFAAQGFDPKGHPTLIGVDCSHSSGSPEGYSCDMYYAFTYHGQRNELKMTVPGTCDGQGHCTPNWQAASGGQDIGVISAGEHPASGGATTPTTVVSGATQTYSGNGTENLGTITLATDSTLAWTNTGDRFQIFTTSGSDPLPVDSQGSSGTSYMAAGTYTNVQVNAIGSWTIRIVPK